ncbi:MAG: hypothetical protein CVV44_02610 [Spirochaetae bacterium HGW-Spirochaetae-1]|jgi:hypothetical protein|nr:MAG: hypothetical protein CVV44_02610 [Spirochaetae bacterium HGW-Spirochaetae-1]
MRRIISISGKFFAYMGIMSACISSGCMPPAAQINSADNLSLKAYATGDFVDRITVSWSEMSDASLYRMYRAETPEGPYESIKEFTPSDDSARIVNADPYVPIPVVEEPEEEDNDEIDPVYLNFSYTSEEDLSSGKYIAALQIPQLRILMGSADESTADIDIVVSFPTLVTWVPTTWSASYTPGLIASAINDAAGRQICDISEDGNHLEFVSTWGPIVFKNENNTLSYTPIDYFIKDGVGRSQVLVVNKDGSQVLDEDDFTGSFPDYFGEEPVEDPAETHKIREFNEDCVYYFDDMDSALELNKRYYYRMQALRSNNTLVSMSNYTIGRSVSATAPSPVKNITVSTGNYADRITLAWEPLSLEGVTYTIYRKQAGTLNFDYNNPLIVGLLEPAYEDTSVPAGLFNYEILAVNAAGEEGTSSTVPSGWRTATDLEFLRVAYWETIEGEKRTAQALGVPRVADYDSGANVSVNIYGLDGKVNYSLNVNVATMSGTGTWTFYNYRNFSVFMNGSNSMDSGSSKDGTVRGPVAVSGIYNGTVTWNIVVDNGDASGGYFIVSQDGGAPVQINFTQELRTCPY